MPRSHEIGFHIAQPRVQLYSQRALIQACVAGVRVPVGGPDQVHIRRVDRKVNQGQIVSGFIFPFQVCGGKGVEKVHGVEGKSMAPGDGLAAHPDFTPGRGK